MLLGDADHLQCTAFPILINPQFGQHGYTVTILKPRYPDHIYSHLSQLHPCPSLSMNTMEVRSKSMSCPLPSAHPPVATSDDEKVGVILSGHSISVEILPLAHF